MPLLPPLFSPLDEELGLRPGALTPRLQEQLAQLGAWMPFVPAAQMLTRFTGVAVSAATARRLTEGVGRAALAVEEAAVARRCDELPPVPAGPERAVVSVEGAMVPLVGGEWAEVTTLVVGEVAAPPAAAMAGTEVHTTAVSTCSRLADGEPFNEAVLVELYRRGSESARQVAAVSDGAEWIQGFVDLHCPHAVRILDVAHAAQHVALIGQTVAPEDATWRAPRRHCLKHEGPELVLADRHAQVDHVAAVAQPPLAVSEARTYLDKRVALREYPAFAAAGWPLGSGSGESANKLVVAARLKGAGMPWARPNVTPLLVLRTAACNDRWDEAWGHSATQLRQHPLPRCPRPSAPPPPEPPPPPAPPRPPARHPWRAYTPGWLSAKL
jgi:hypothetical protein